MQSLKFCTYEGTIAFFDASNPDGDVSSDTNTPKVGDTLNAIVLGGAGTYTYEWTFNGIVVGATSTYTVPLDATTGDVIAVTVTDADGNTASDSAIVSGLTIVSVEPTTASGQDANGNDIGYKYVRIFFSEPLSSLDASEIEIRHTKTKQLYSIETVKLSSTGLFADVILYGSLAGDGTTFLQANEPYVATVTHDGLTDSLEFELPANDADAVVVAVNTDKNTIRTAASGRSNQVVHASTYNLGLSYTGNLGQLIGRTVNYAYNADAEISDFTVQDEAIVIDTVKLYAGSDGNTIADDYFKGSDGTQYYFENDDKSTKNKTVVYNAKDVKATTNNGTVVDQAWVTGRDGRTYSFAKLVLNPNGTVARAFLQETVPTFLKVQSMSGTTAIADKATSMNFDGYTIFDAATSDLLDATDLNEGDNVFYSIADKFAYVYNESVSGELDNVVAGKFELDGVEYNWGGANGTKYFDDASGKFVDLKNDTPANSTKAQDYLNSLDPDEVEAQLWMSGDVAFVYGDVVGETKTTTTTYIVTQTASMAAVGFDNLMKLPVHDGTTASTLTIDPMKFKSYDGKAGKTTDTTTTTFDFDYTDAANTDVTVTPSGVFTINTLVDVVTDENGVVIGLKSYGKKAVTGTDNKDNTGNKGTVNKDTVIVTTDAGTFKMNASTNVWIFVKDGTKANSVKKMKFSDYTLETVDLKNNTKVKVYADTKDAAVKSLIIVQEDKDVDAFQKGDKAKVEGFVTDVKYVRNSDGSESNVLKSVTITEADGTSNTYEGDGSYAGTITAGGVYELEYYKSSEQVLDATVEGGDGTKKIHAAKDYSNSELTMSDGYKVIPASDCLILKQYKSGGDDVFDPITVEEITSASNGWDVTFWAVSTETGKSSVANFIKVEDNGTNLTNQKAAELAKINTITTNGTVPFALNATTSSATKQTFNVNAITGVSANGPIFLQGATATATSSDFTCGAVKINGADSTLATTGATGNKKALITITTKLGNALKVELTTDPTLVATSLKVQTATTVGTGSDLAPGAATNGKKFVGSAGDILDQYGNALSGTEGDAGAVTNVSVTKQNADTDSYTYTVAATVAGGVPTFTVSATGGTTEGNLAAGDTISFTFLGSNVTYTVGANAAAGKYSVTAA